MNLQQIPSRKEYDKVMSKIESLLQKATELGGFEKLSKTDRADLSQLSVIAEQYEDDVPLMPILSK